MPVRLSGPRLLLYTIASFGFASFALWRAYNTTGGDILNTISVILRSSGYSAILINLAFNLLVLFAKFVQILFFGSLSEDEANKMWDRMVNYMLWKVLVVGAILEPSMRDLVVWTTWFSLIGLMHTFSGLAAERFKNLMTYSPNAVWWAHARLVALHLCLLFADLGWFYLCISVFSEAGSTQVFLLIYECFTLFIDCTSGLVKNLIHFIDLSRGGNWESRGSYMFYADVIASAILLAATLGHYAVILFIHGVSFNVVDVLIFVNMRIVWTNLKNKIDTYRNYRKLATDMNQRYPLVPEDELANFGDSCAICREHMASARRLPCGHIFHTGCLRSWLEYNHTCPTCRFPLIDDQRRAAGAAARPGGGPAGPNGAAGPAPDPNNPVGSVWRFNSNWMGWLPSLSVEVVRARQDPAMLLQANPFLAQQVRMVQTVFPDMPDAVILQDLIVTNSAEVTINNILEGRVVAPSQPQQQQPQPAPAAVHPQAPAAPVAAARAFPFAARPEASPPRTPTHSAPSSPTSPSSPSQSNFVATSPPSLRDSFGATPERRQMSLAQRKQQMLEYARQQFLDKQKREQEAAMQPQAPPAEPAPSQPAAPSALSSSQSSSTSPYSSTFAPAAQALPQEVPSSYSLYDPTQASGLRRRQTQSSEPSETSEVAAPAAPVETVPETAEERRRKFLEAAQRRLANGQS